MRMFLVKVFHLAFIFVVAGILPVFGGAQDIWGSTFMLDKEVVFSIYYKLSEKGINELDMEDLYFESGRPVFTLYKPSEMFMRNSLRRLIARINERVKDYDEDSLFKWSFECSFTSDKLKRKTYQVVFNDRGMPQPTPYISSEISDRGRRYVKKLLNDLAAEMKDLGKDRELDITLYLRPEKIDYRFQKRYVALEDIILPIRCIIFHPVKMQFLDKIMTIEE